ncbi:MAG: ATP synthase F1 subunit delta [Candidatus Sumerlaeota bacterium]
MQDQDIPILDVYARALADAAADGPGVDVILQEARELLAFLKTQYDLMVFLEKPAIELSDKKALVRKAFESQLSPLMMNLPLLLIDKHRGGYWPGVLERYIREIEIRRGIYAASVESALKLDEDQKKVLQETLEKKMGHELRISWRVVPKLLGGVRFRCGDTLIDGTLRQGLEEIEHRLREITLEPLAGTDDGAPPAPKTE